MYGGMRVTKQNSIFNLIRNGSLDDLKKLIDIAPEKLNDMNDEYNPLDWAIKHEKSDMAAFLKTQGLEETDFAKENIYMNISLNIKNNRSLNELKKIIMNKDLSFIPQDEKISIFKDLAKKSYLKDGKIDELMKQKLFDNLNEENSLNILKEAINYYDISLFKIGVKNGANSKILSFGLPILAYAIKNCNLPDALERIKLLIDNGADVQYKAGGFTYFNNLIAEKKPVEFYKVFVDAGLDIDTKLADVGLTLLFITIGRKNKPLFDFVIENGANVNVKLTGGNTPLMTASAIIKDLYYVEQLITHGAEVNAVNDENGTALMLAVKYADHEDDLKIIKYLLDKGADKTIKTNNATPKTVIDLAWNRDETNLELYKKILTLLGKEFKVELWKGSTRSDIEKYDIFFEKPFDYSCCPICLEYIERKEGCMYMSHNCAATKHYYHEKLYDTYAYGAYEGAPKKVEWCTVCGRVTKNHKHYIVSLATNPSTTLAALDPEIQARLDANQNVVFFDNANCVGFGGGGTLEKAARFRRLREYTLELQQDVDKKKHNDVMDELIEEVFNAPLIRNRKLEKILQDKKWNINIDKFPENVRNTINNNNNNRNYANIIFEGVLPTLLPSKDHDCIIMGDDDEGKEENPVVHFHHETRGGMNHDGIDICQKDLARAIEVANKEFGDERFGKCWFPQCQAILHPEEIKNNVPEVLYLDYKKKFNKKMAKAGGHRYTRKTNKTRKYKGGKNNSKHESVLHKLDFSEVTCALPNFTKNGKLRKV